MGLWRRQCVGDQLRLRSPRPDYGYGDSWGDAIGIFRLDQWARRRRLSPTPPRAPSLATAYAGDAIGIFGLTPTDIGNAYVTNDGSVSAYGYAIGLRYLRLLGRGTTPRSLTGADSVTSATSNYYATGIFASADTADTSAIIYNGGTVHATRASTAATATHGVLSPIGTIWRASPTPAPSMRTRVGYCRTRDWRRGLQLQRRWRRGHHQQRFDQRQRDQLRLRHGPGRDRRVCRIPGLASSTWRAASFPPMPMATTERRRSVQVPTEQQFGAFIGYADSEVTAYASSFYGATAIGVSVATGYSHVENDGAINAIALADTEHGVSLCHWHIGLRLECSGHARQQQRGLRICGGQVRQRDRCASRGAVRSLRQCRQHRGDGLGLPWLRNRRLYRQPHGRARLQFRRYQRESGSDLRLGDRHGH